MSVVAAICGVLTGLLAGEIIHVRRLQIDVRAGRRIKTDAAASSGGMSPAAMRWALVLVVSGRTSV